MLQRRPRAEVTRRSRDDVAARGAADSVRRVRLRRALASLATRPITALFLVALAIVLFSVLAPSPTGREYDHNNFREIVAAMRHGQSYYRAYAPVYRMNGTTIGCSTAFRPPLAFEFWRLFPVAWLWGVYLVVVVGGTCALIAFNARWPLVALPVALYLLDAGRAISRHGPVIDQFLDVELWIVPLIALALVLYRRRRLRSAVGVGIVTPLVRELGLIFLLAGLFTAVLRRLPKIVWVGGIVVAVAFLGLHYHLASQHTYANGICVKLFGSGHPPSTVLEMMDAPIPGSVYFGLALWLAALWEVVYRGDGPLAAPILLLAFAGVFVRRDYWGFVFIPFEIWWACEAAMRISGMAARRWRPESHPRSEDDRRARLLPPTRTPS